MMRKIFSALLVLILCFCLAIAVSANAASSDLFLIDEADLLTDSQEATLAEKLERVSNTYQAQLVVVTMNSFGYVDSELALEYIYDSMGFGYGPNRDGVLLLICMETREYQILSNGFPGEAIDSYDIEIIGDAIVPGLSDGDYAYAFDEFIDQCQYYLEGYLNGYPFQPGATLVVCLAVGLVVGLIVALILKGQLKTIRKQHAAHAYCKPGSMQVSVHRDVFLYRNVTRTEKESSSSSGRSSGGSSGGSSRSTGGGSF
jgi:uncharacterized protein